MTNVLLLGIVKNVGNVIVNNISNMFSTLGNFNKSKIIIYENNSTDNTKQLLKSLHHDQLIVISEDIPKETRETSKVWAYTKITNSDHSCRVEQISNARNKLIDEINKPEYDEYDVVVWIDMDFNNIKMNNIGKLTEEVKNNKKLVLVGNSPRYYDFYALRMNINSSNKEMNSLLGPEIIGDIFWKNMNYNTQFNNRTKVDSGFNGIGIYNKEVFKTNRYDFLVNDHVKEYYKNLLANNTTLMKYKKIIQAEDTKFPGGEFQKNVNIYWKNNSGYDKPVLCEHVCLHYKLINEHYDIYIDPNLMYYR